MKKRIFNFRSFLLISISVILAILCMWLNFICYPLGFILLGIEVILLIALLLYYIKSGAPRFKRITCVTAIIFLSVAAVNFYVTVQKTEYVSEEKQFFISGEVDYVDPMSGEIILKDAFLRGVDGKSGIALYVDFEENPDLYSLKVGNELLFYANLKSVPILEENNTINAYPYRTGIKYVVFDFLDTPDIVYSSPDFLQALKLKIKDNLVLAMGSEHGLVAYGMLTGDGQGIDEGLRDAYSVSGLGHILAISGLHIGFISAMLLGFFRLIRLKKSVASIVTLVILWFYAFFTGFSPSVLRAVVMASIMLLTRLFSKRYDVLNSLGAASSVILLIAPVLLFDKGFIMSVSAVLGMIIFTKPLERLFTKIKIPKFLAKGAGVSIGAQVGILPAMIMCFGRFQLYAPILNVFLIPIASVAFSFILIASILTLICPPLIVLLRFSGLLMALIDTAAVAAASLPLASVPVLSRFGLAALIYPLYFFAGRFTIKSKKKIRILSAALAVAFCFAVLGTGIALTPKYEGNDYAAPVSSYGEISTLVKHRERVYFIGDAGDYNEAFEVMNRMRVKRIDAFFLTKLDKTSADTVVKISKRYKTGKIFAYENGELSGFSVLKENGLSDRFSVFSGSVKLTDDVEAVIENDRFLCYELFTDKGSMLFCGYGVNYTRLPISAVDRSFLIRSFMYLDTYDDRCYITNMERGFRDLPVPSYQYTLADDGMFVFDFKIGHVYSLEQ